MLYASLTANRTPCRLIVSAIILLIIQLLFFLFFLVDLISLAYVVYQPKALKPGTEEEHQYSDLFAEHHTYEKPSSQRKSPGDEDYNNSDVCLHNADYQPLHVNRRSEPTYAALETESKV